MTEKRTVRIGHEGGTPREVEIEVPNGEPAIWDAGTRLQVAGSRTPRLDGVAKVTGAARYTYDISLPGMLYGRVLRSPHRHARILGIDASKAARLAGVKTVVTFERADSFAALGETDEAGKAIETEGGAAKVDPTRTIRFAGEEVAAVAATSADIAEDALALIEVRYETLPHVVDLEEARRSDAPKVYPAGNAQPPTVRERGSIQAGFDDAAVVIEGTYKTPVAVHHALETHGAVARWEGNRLTVWASTQGVFGFRDDLAKFFGIPSASVRVISEYLGGGFGAKFGAGITGVVAALLARKAGAPVKLMLDRHEESLATGNRPNSVQWIKVGAKRDGTLTAIHLKSYGTGGIAGGAGVSGPVRLMYACANVKTEEQDIHTHAGFAMPFRAPGYPQGSFALESALDEMADRLGIDPLALRKVNYIDKPGKALMREYDLAAEAAGWSRRARPPRPAKADGTVRRGFGLGTAMWPMYGGPPADASVTIHPDGRVECICGTQDLGTGTRTAMAMVTAEVLGLMPADVKVRLGDTATGLYSPASGGSVTLTTILPAVRAAAEGARAKLLQAAAPALGGSADDLVLAEGRVRRRDGSKSLTLAQAVARTKAAGITAQAARAENYKGTGVESYGAQFAEVEVDTATGRVRVVKVVAAHDCGRLINPMTAESQVNGGVVMGLSYALLEQRFMDGPTGLVLNPNLEAYKIAGPLEMPEIVPIMVDVYDPANNVGVKGLGEPPVVPTAAAIANAVSNAIGRRVRELPITPDRVLAMLREEA